MVEALRPVAKAILGDLTDMYRPIRELNPDIITLGCNQHFNPEILERTLEKQGMQTKVVRISAFTNSPFTSSRDIVQEVIRRSDAMKRHIEPGDHSSGCDE